MCDEDATLELRVKTVHYFKGLQKTAGAIEEVDFGYDAHRLQRAASASSAAEAGGGGGGLGNVPKRQKISKTHSC